MQEIERIQVDVSDLRPGMYVAELDRPWLGTPFLFQGFSITTAEELAQLRHCCRYVYVDVTQSTVLPPRSRGVQVTSATEVAGRAPQDIQAFTASLQRSRQSYEHAHDYIRQVMKDVRLGQAIDPAEAREVVNTLVPAIMANESAMLWLTLLKHRDEYTTRHSINVCIMSLLFGRHLGLNEEDLHELGHGALLHDIGKMKVPLEILNKTARLTTEEITELKRHAAYGYAMLRDSPHIGAEALEVVRSHHERVDGSGYPRGLRDGAIHRYALIVAVVDVYDAITSERVYHMGIAPHEALNLMYGWTPQSFPADLIEAFIRCLGIYPIGSIVELDSGEVGVVTTMNLAQRLKPIVMLVLNARKQAYPVRKLVNLAAFDEVHRVNIKRILQSNAYGIDVRSLVFDQVVAQVPAAL